MRVATYSMQAFFIILTACSSVQKLPSAPEWLGSDLKYPEAHMFSAYDTEFTKQVDHLRLRLNENYKMCSGSISCQEAVIGVGRRVWQVALVTYGTVNANVPTIDKKQALENLREAIAAIPRCSS